jgi:ABC-type nitrate/sulfonate/bicarbonate transport system substrate-binding protein
MKSRDRVLLLTALIFFTACLVLDATAAAQAADPVKIRLSYMAPITNWDDMISQKKDLAKNLGKSYQIEVTRFAGTAPMITALAASELDIAALDYPTLPVGLRNAGMDDLRVIADGRAQTSVSTPASGHNRL